MRTVLKNIVSRTYKPWLVKYLSKTRVYSYGNIRLEIPPDVFHPGFFFSTQLLRQYIDRFPLKEKKLLELGAGSGLISTYAAKKGAHVVASDINPVAVKYLTKNSIENKVTLNIILSDLFDDIPVQTFDIITINPPYYKKKPETWIDHAWYCGEKGEYFFKLFRQLPGFMHKDSEVIMTLCEECDIKMIEDAATVNHFRLRCIQTRQNLLEKNFIYKIEIN
jgi:release factor glutamine methyltransferase